MNKFWHNLLFFSIICAALYSLYTDIKLQEPYPDDLRNRVVGSRLMKDGFSPYYYHWKQGESTRYYEPETISMMYNLKISACTATPFFHLLIAPIVDLPQIQFDVLWLAIQYIAMLACIWLIANANVEPKKSRRFMFGIMAVTFTYCYGWRFHTLAGQNYIFIALFSALSYYCFKRHKSLAFIVLAGVSSAALVLLKPITAFIILPFLFFPKRFLAVGISSFIVMVLYISWSVINPFQQKNWQDYFTSSVQHEAMHKKDLDYFFPKNNIVKTDIAPTEHVYLATFEGIVTNPDYVNENKEKMMLGNECGSFYYIYFLATKKKASNLLLSGLGILAVIILMSPMLLLYKKQHQALGLEELFLLGFTLYRTIEFFMPVPMGLYQWGSYLFPLLLFVRVQHKVFSWSSIFVMTGLIFNLFIIPKISFDHTLGQFMILGAFIILVYKSLLPDKILGLSV